MEGMSSLTMLILAATLTTVIWYILDYRFAPKHLQIEPPVIPQSIPYVGHIIGIFRFGTKYYEMISTKFMYPIYTLNTLNRKLYIITSPELVKAVDRSSKTLAFNPVIAQVAQRMTGYDEASRKIIDHNLNGEEGPGYIIDGHNGIVPVLLPGKNLEEMTLTMLQEASLYLTTLEKENGKEIDLFSWTRKTLTICSTRAIYGPENPFSKDSKLEEMFWDFDYNVTLLLLGFGFLAPKGRRGRAEVGAAFGEYFENYVPGQTQSSAMILARYMANTQHRLTAWNQGRIEVATLIGILANTIPTMFYMLAYVYSDLVLLQDLREELENTSVSILNENSKTIKILSVREKCPLLYSTFQELLRLHAKGPSTRFVREDTLLNNQYLLQKGSFIQIPFTIMHLDPHHWGSDAKEFKPTRFLTKKNTTAIYKPFSGGISLCPGRHFVAMEILALTAVLVLRFDLQPVDRVWCVPEQKQESLATSVFPPARDVRVRVWKRRGEEETVWGFEMA